MNKINFHDFYDYIWEDEVLEITVSTAYLEKNEEFIRNLTLEYFRLYELSAFPAKYFKKIIEITFTNLFLFNPGTKNIKEIRDGFRNAVERS
jgi:hypothetical protein